MLRAALRVRARPTRAIARHASAQFRSASTVISRASQRQPVSIAATLSISRPTYPLFAQSSRSSSSDSAALAKPDSLDAAESEIWTLLSDEFSPTELNVQDISGGCGSMYLVEICSDKFRGTNMLKQQRMVNAVLKDKMKDWHGLQLKTSVPA